MTIDNKPAILGGKPIFDKQFEPYRTIGIEEQKAVEKVMKSGKLSGYLGAWSPEFYGGSKVRELENHWAEYFNVKHAIVVNSWTSGLYAILGAIGLEPGDEVLVTPTTMTASVAGIVLYQAIPIFVDIDPDTYCIDPKEILKKITNKTKAIIGVNIYGETADWDLINEIAIKNNIITIEDAAQSIGGLYNNIKSGTLADVGGYSLNRHKHIHCGEGGVCVTNNDEIAERIRLIRNHGEAVVADKGTKDIRNIIGFNFRMTELEASIAIEQLKKLERLVDKRISTCKKIIKAFTSFEGISYPKLYSGTSITTKHVYYYLCFNFDPLKVGISRKAFVASMKAEGIPLGEGGYIPVYLQPMYQRKIAFGSKGHPFTADYYGKEISYPKGLCPVAEKMWFKQLFYFEIQNFSPNEEQVKNFNNAINKVLKNKEEINNKFKE
jgi:dTDP-4-amino-4,6-dideoxygalactose transaminase